MEGNHCPSKQCGKTRTLNEDDDDDDEDDDDDDEINLSISKQY